MASKHSGKPSRDTAFLALMFSVFACGSCVLGRKRHNTSSKSPTPTSDFGGIESVALSFFSSPFLKIFQLLPKGTAVVLDVLGRISN